MAPGVYHTEYERHPAACQRHATRCSQLRHLDAWWQIGAFSDASAGVWHKARMPPAAASTAALALCAALCVSSVACDDHESAPSAAPAQSHKGAATKPAPSAVTAAPPPPTSTAAAPDPPEASAAPATSATPSASGQPDEAAALPDTWRLDELADVAPAGPATATNRGVVMVTRDNQVHLASYTPLAAGAEPGETQVRPLAITADNLVAQRRGPAVQGDFAYWIDGNNLLRRALSGKSELETLARDARHSTRVSAVQQLKPNEPGLVAYIAGGPKADSPLKAHLWVEGAGTFDVSDEAATANSVALTRSSKGLVVLSLEARTGMTPIHARGVRVEGKQLKLSDDLVVWVGGPAEPLTEIIGGSYPNQRFGFMAMGRSAAEFGLAAVDVGDEPRMGAAVRWIDYPNGLDPAPVAATVACKRSLVAFVQPETSRPGSLQQLRVGFVGAGGVGESFVVAHSRGFANVSIAGNRRGALVAYTADRRTWARALRCR